MARTKSSSETRKVMTVGVTIPEERLVAAKKYYHFISSIMDLPIELSFNDFILHMAVSRTINFDKQFGEIKLLKSITGKTVFLSLRMSDSFYRKFLIVGERVSKEVNLGDNKGNPPVKIDKFLKENLASYISSTINEFGQFQNLLASLIYFHFLEIVEKIFGELIIPNDKLDMIKHLEFPKILRDGKDLLNNYMSLIQPFKGIESNEEKIIFELREYLNTFNTVPLKEYSKSKLASELYNIRHKYSEILTLDILTGDPQNYGDKFDIQNLLESLKHLERALYDFKDLKDLPNPHTIEYQIELLNNNYQKCESESKQFYSRIDHIIHGNMNDNYDLYRNEVQNFSGLIYLRVLSVLLP